MPKLPHLTNRPPPRQMLPVDGGLPLRLFDLLLKFGAVTGTYSQAFVSAAGLGASPVVAGLAFGAPPVVAALAGLYSIGRANERGEALGNYNAFIAAFAQSISDFSRGEDRRRQNVAFRNASVEGRNAAIHFLDAIGAEKRAQVFARYHGISDVAAVQAIVRSLGGYMTG